MTQLNLKKVLIGARLEVFNHHCTWRTLFWMFFAKLVSFLLNH